MQVVWLKYVMFKESILKGAIKNSKIIWQEYMDWIKKNDHFFLEGKKHEIVAEPTYV
jgi:hypothetical protein